MKVLVTGATGFVGSHLVDRLLAAGDEVTALVRSLERAAPLAERGVRLVTGDLHATTALRDAARGQEVVYHVAALVGAVNEDEFLRANREGTAAVQADCLVEVVEPAGSDTFVVTRLGGVEVIARMHADAVIRPGEQAPFAFAMGKAVLFDPETGQRLR